MCSALETGNRSDAAYLRFALRNGMRVAASFFGIGERERRIFDNGIERFRLGKR